MDKNRYEDALIELYTTYDLTKFKVQLVKQKIFVCGGIVNIRLVKPESFRGYFFERTAQKEPILESSLVMAESFKDYFKDYIDLVEFEDDIASISSLIIIFLESPGSLVELGIFSTKIEFHNKLLVIVPNDKDEDSFINLGPLAHISKKTENSILRYPFPSSDISQFDTIHIDDLIVNINNRLKVLDKTQTLDLNNKTHIILLICEIIRLSFPVTLTDIEFCLAALNIENYSQKLVKRFLYLLEKLEYIKKYIYSNYNFYYPDKKYRNEVFVKFGSRFDAQKHTLTLRQAYNDNSDSSRKRQAVMKHIFQEFNNESN